MSRSRKSNLIVLLILVVLSACAAPQEVEEADLILGYSNRSFVIEFGEGVDRKAIQASAQIKPNTPINLTWQDNTLRVNFERRFSAAERFVFSVDEDAIQELASAGEKHTWVIETEPYDVSFRPRNESSADRVYIVDFNYPVDPQSIERAITIEPFFTPEFEWDDAFKMLTLKPNTLIPATNYSISIPPYAFTLGDPPDQAFVWEFMAPSFDVNFNQQIVDEETQRRCFEFVFNYPLNDRVFEDLLTIDPLPEYRAIWNSAYSELTLSTNEPLKSDTQYAFELALRPLEGSDIDWQEIHWTSYFSSSAVAVKTRRMDARSRTPAIDLRFNYPMDKATVEQAIEVSPSFAYELIWNQYGTQATLNAMEGLEPGREYEVIIGESAQDLEGNPLSKLGRIGFTTNKIIEERTYSSSWNRDEPWSITFGYPMDPESFAQQAYADPYFEYDLSWSLDNTKVVIEPREALLGNQVYALRFSEPLIDAAGYSLGELTSLRFSNPSPIIGFIPDTYKPFRTDQEVVIDFDRTLDPIIALQALNIDPPLNVSYIWQGGDLAIVPPDEGWESGQRYTITLDPSVRDNAGREVILEPVETSFSVAGPSRFVSFGGFGSDVQVVDLEGPRNLQIASSSTAIDTVQIDFYRISVEQYLDFAQTPNLADEFSYPRFRYQPEYDLTNSAFIGSWQLPVTYLLEPEYYNPVGEIQLPGELSSGLYVVSLVHEDFVRDQLLVNLSSAVVVVKEAPVLQGGGQITVWVNNLNDFVMPQTRISVFDKEGRVISSGETDEIGMFQGSYAEDSEPYLVVARRADEISISGVSGSWGSYQSSRSSNKFFAYIYTDSPIYRPGHTVNFKSILRLDNDVQYQLPPEGTILDLTVYDPRKNVVERHSLNTNQYGSVAGEIALHEDIMLGVYRFELSVDGTIFDGSFLVQEYEKPDFTIDVSSDKDAYIVGETITLDIDTEYLFGEPVPNAQLEVRWYDILHRFSSYKYDWLGTDVKQVLQTDASGHATVEVLAPFREQDYYYSGTGRPFMRWGIEASADDGSNQFNSGTTIFEVYRQLYLPDIRTERYWHQSDEAVNINVSLSSPFDEPLARQELSVIFERRGGISFGWEYEEFEKQTITTDEDGVASIVYEPTMNGRYRLILRGVDRIGHVYEDISYFSVYDRTRSWYRDFEEDLSVTVEGDEYAVGDTAQLIIESSFDGEALLTLERGSVREERLIALTSPITLVDVPITSDFAPNIYAFVQAWQPIKFSWDDLPDYYYYPSSQPDGELMSASAQIYVPDTQHALQIEITPDQDSYAPREEASFDIRVVDSEGQPVQAELSLALVDEAIFLLSDERSKPIHSAFFSPRGLGVFSYNSMNPGRDLVLGDYSGGRGGGGDEGLLGNPRADFPDTVVWLPAVETDADGNATLTVTLPDTLTSWRLTVKAVSLNTEVGETTSNILTQQPAVLRPLPPSNLIEGDTFTFSTIVHNFSDEDAEFLVYIDSPGFGLGFEDTQTVTLRAGELQVVAWQSQAQAAGEVAVTVVTQSSVGEDAISMTIPVEPLALRAVSTDVGIFSGELSLPMIIDSNAHEVSTLDIEISNSIAGSLLSGVEYLTGYPYGCVEQVMSRALPNAVVGRAFDQLGYAERANSVNLNKKTLQSIQRLYALQHGDGGWGWWYDDSSDEYQTAWVIFGLATTAQAGYEVDESVIMRGTDWLSNNMFSMDPATRAFALYSMAVAGHGDLQAAQFLAENPDRLDTFALASLAITLGILGDSSGAESILDDLLAQVERIDADTVAWGERNQDGYYRSKTMASQVRTTAIVLSTLLRLDSENELIPDAVNWLMSQRKHRGWGTTNETAFTILALTDYVVFNEAAGSDASFQVFVDNDRLIAEDQFNASTMGFSYSIPLSELNNGQNELRVETEADTSLYYVISKNLFVEDTEITGAGIPVTRSFLDPETRRPLFEIEEGQLILVRLEIEMPRDGWYILLEDYLPGGIEAINEGLNTASVEVLNDISESYYYYSYENPVRFFWQSYGYNYKEIRSNYVSFFVTRLSEGTRVIEYYARAVTPGVYAVMPTQLSAMYNPEIWGYSDSNTIEVVGVEP